MAHAEMKGISPNKGSILIMILGGSTAIGRVMFGKIIEFGFLNRVHMHQLSLVITGALSMILPLIGSFGGLVAYVVIIGLVDGCFVVLLPVLTTTLLGVENKEMAWGFLISLSSITFTIGPPIAGWWYCKKLPDSGVLCGNITEFGVAEDRVFFESIQYVFII